MTLTEQMNTLEIGHSFSRVTRVDIHAFDPAEVNENGRALQSSTVALASRLPKKKFVVERIDALTTSREHIVTGIVCTRIK